MEALVTNLPTYLLSYVAMNIIIATFIALEGSLASRRRDKDHINSNFPAVIWVKLVAISLSHVYKWIA